MSQVIYLDFGQLIEIHNDLIEKYGGSHGTRDEALAQSALSRPTSSFGGEDLYTTIYLKAAALGHSIISNHPFLDGNKQSFSANKRTGVVSMIVFLELNGLILAVEQSDLVETAVKIATKELNIEAIATWLEKYSIKSS